MSLSSVPVLNLQVVLWHTILPKAREVIVEYGDDVMNALLIYASLTHGNILFNEALLDTPV